MLSWDGFELFRLVSAPRPPVDGPNPAPAQLYAALTAAHATLAAEVGSAIVVGWVRPPGTDRLSFVVGGRPFFPPADGARSTTGDLVPILYPPGTVGRRVSAEDVGSLVAGLPHWIACAGTSDALWMPTDGSPGAATGRGSFDDYAAHLSRPFGWLVVAEPLAASVVEDERSRINVSLPGLRKKESSEQARLDVQRAEVRFRELTKARITGLWQVRVLVGGETPVAAAAAAALLCSAGELDEVPYVLMPSDRTGSLDEVAGATLRSEGNPQIPFAATGDLVRAVARPPARELPGIRMVTPHRFDVTPEHVDDGGIALGDVLDEAYRSAGPFTVPRPTLNRHAFICGATGSGKSQTMRTLLESLSRDGDRVPWLVIEPAKAEYARMAGRLAGVDEVTVIRPGDARVAPASLNPLEPADGFPLQSHADLVRALFLAAFEADEPFPQVLSRALTQVYSDAGWNLVTGRQRLADTPKFHADDEDRRAVGRYPTLGDLQRTAQDVVARIGYGKEVTADVRGFVDVRMGSLREGTPGRFFEGGHPLDVEALLSRNVVLELEDITNDQDKAFLIGAVLIRIVEHLRVRSAQDAAPGLRHVTVVEEAHRLLKNVEHGPAAAAVELFASLLAEIRAYGEGVVVVEQIPSKILPDVIKNSALKVMHRLPALDDRRAVGGTINLTDEQSELVVSFPPGIAAAAVDGMDRPVMVRIPPGEDAEDARLARSDPPLSGSRSLLCDVDCLTRPCALEMIDDAAHRARDPHIVVWVDAVVTAHVIGRPAPTPTAATLRALGAAGPARVDCALVHAVERAVVARRSGLAPWLDPAAFASHVLGVVCDLAAGKPAVDDRDWLRWTAGWYRWQEIRTELGRAVDRGEGAAPRHPSSGEWEKLGLRLEADTLAGQLDELKAHPSYRDGREWVTVGEVATSGLVDAVDELTGATTRQCLDAALRAAATGPALPVIAGQIAHLVCSPARPDPEGR